MLKDRTARHHLHSFSASLAFRTPVVPELCKWLEYTVPNIMRVGVLGRGFMGTTHLKALAGITDIEIAAECEIAKVIADPRVDAVDICLPTNLHAPVALQALQAGKHVLVEKPMALDVESSRQMIAEAKKQERVLMVAQVLRFFPMYTTLREILSSGRIGAPRSAIFRRRCGAPAWGAWLSDPKQSGGGVFDLLIHDMDLCLHLFGSPETVSATGYEALADGVDVVTAELHYDGGLTAVITGGWHHPKSYPFSMEYTVVAERGTVEYSSLGRAPTLFRADGEIEMLPMSDRDGYRAEIEYFLNCCRRDENPNLCPPEESADAVAMALCILEARKRNGERLRCQL
jgi:predicted dehydrogenase